MSIPFTHRHILEDRMSGYEPSPNANHLTVLRRPVIFSALAHAGHEASVAEALSLVENIVVRSVSPSDWLLVSQNAEAGAIAASLGAVPGLSFAEQSDGQVLMAVSGPDVRKILAKCVAVDLHADAFAEGESAPMMICRVAGNLARTGTDTFEILVPRSYAGYVFDELREAGREYAMTRGFGE
ncbi:sarcosine oxidase subunit gamma [Rhizobiales bacterium RZME27]|uniref:Sarcosine oxidase subunit gamma n=1 Tax=Endobacterium cereale TaxID=2663029 RepID=A0A6A8AL82_9HYPH|nr:sarcosine oxidase subunit gamma family protein [Endobacterium cereale]MEB2842812.1 sarcosine oxidase subunit gamma family protein [Endobacterium cereale]MQY49926.1 sarcosine oxidase subunit gamma [Endobacterium cereale]